LIIAGCGSVGRSLWSLPVPALSGFDEVVAVDRDPGARGWLPGRCRRFFRGDVNDPVFLRKTLHGLSLPVLFLNTASHADNLALRKVLAPFDAAYVDASAGLLDGGTELFMERLMPYSCESVSGRRPHVIHFGVNPGMVELIARKLMRDVPDGEYDVMIYEKDDLDAPLGEGRAAVAWSPALLVEELLRCPSFEIVDGRRVEGACGPTRRIIALWEGREVPSRVVGHEEIWNFHGLGNVRNSRFVYGLHPAVMEALEKPPDEALRILEIPGEGIPLRGADRIAVEVRARGRGATRTLLWETDHRKTREAFGLNAVQYQTGASILFLVDLLQGSALGTAAGGTYTGSTLPLEASLLDSLDVRLRSFGINWRDGSDLRLGTRDPAPPAAAAAG
jgi:saccharopine dehydrogenase-like NADP-dependent oxidoreductase